MITSTQTPKNYKAEVYDFIDADEFYTQITEEYKYEILKGALTSYSTVYISSSVYYNTVTKTLTNSGVPGQTIMLFDTFHLKRYNRNKLVSELFDTSYWNLPKADDSETWTNFSKFMKDSLKRLIKKNVKLIDELNTSNYSYWDAKWGKCLPSQLSDKELVKLFSESDLSISEALTHFNFSDEKKRVEGLLVDSVIAHRDDSRGFYSLQKTLAKNGMKKAFLKAYNELTELEYINFVIRTSSSEYPHLAKQAFEDKDLIAIAQEISRSTTNSEIQKYLMVKYGIATPGQEEVTQIVLYKGEAMGISNNVFVSEIFQMSNNDYSGFGVTLLPYKAKRFLEEAKQNNWNVYISPKQKVALEFLRQWHLVSPTNPDTLTYINELLFNSTVLEKEPKFRSGLDFI